MIYKVTVNMQFLIDERHGYKPAVDDITFDIFNGLTGRTLTVTGETIKRDIKIIDYCIDSEKVI